MIKVRRALISVSDKQGLVEFCQGLQELAITLISSGGTAAFLRDAGLTVTAVEQITGFPELFDGRVKTLHPRIHGGILARRDSAADMRQAAAHEIEPIDLVVVNLYPFAQTVSRADITPAEAIEQIDIGGPALLRSAAKNFAFVAAVCNPRQYPQILAQVRAGGIEPALARDLAVEVFRHTRDYDTAIAAYLSGEASEAALPSRMTVTLEKVRPLRYGENPHQSAALYRRTDNDGCGMADIRQLHGKELSYNNLLDMDAAWSLVQSFSAPAAVVVKHTNPCGAAVAATTPAAIEAALAGDRLSAFGGIVAINRPLTEAAAAVLAAADFLECVIAPEVSAAALSRLQVKKNLRVIVLSAAPRPLLQFTAVFGGMMVQTIDAGVVTAEELCVVTRRRPTAAEIDQLLFAWQVVKYVKSNAIVLARGTRTVGIGAGQMSRVDSVYSAVRKAGEHCRGAVMASDAFFPKADGIQTAAQAGVVAVIQSGGSLRDAEVIAAADQAGISMVFTGMRHFNH